MPPRGAPPEGQAEEAGGGAARTMVATRRAVRRREAGAATVGGDGPGVATEVRGAGSGRAGGPWAAAPGAGCRRRAAAAIFPFACLRGRPQRAARELRGAHAGPERGPVQGCGVLVRRAAAWRSGWR